MRAPPLASLVLSLGLLASAEGRAWSAEPVDDATRNSARQLGEEAKELFDRGDFAGALDKYQRADALVHVPTLGVRIARTLVKLGRLNEAAERYLAVTRMDLAEGALPVHKEAKENAEAERAALMPRIPGLVVKLDGPAAAVVSLDGAVLPPALYGVRRATDPGPHRLEARNGSEVVTREITLAEGQTLPIDLKLSSLAPPVALVAPAEPLAPSVPVRPVDPLPAPGEGSWRARRAAGFVGLGLGGAGLVAGAVAGALLFSRKSDLEAKGCSSDLACPAKQANGADLGGAVDSYNRQRAASSGLLIGGLAVAGVGLTLVLTAKQPAAPGPTAKVFVTPSGGGLAGVF